MTPLEVSPLGTYVTSGGARVTEKGVEKQQCNAFVLSHLTRGELGETTHSSIWI